MAEKIQEKIQDDGFRKKIIIILISQLLMYVGPLIIPTWGPVTPMGVKMLCVYIGILLIFIGTGDLFSGSLLAIFASCIHGYQTVNGMFQSVFGGSTSVQMVAMITLAYAIRQTGAFEILGRKIIRATRGMKKLPILFCIVFMLALYIVLWYVSGLAAVVTIIPMFEGIAKTVGYEIDEKWHKIMIMILFCLLGAGSYTKGTDGMLLGWIGVFQNSVNFEYNYSPLQFMISIRIILAVLVIVWLIVAMLLGANMKKLANLDFDAIPELRKENSKFNKVQAIALIMFFFVLLKALIANPFPAETLGNTLWGIFDMKVCAFLVMIIGTYWRIDKKPILNVPKALAALPWGVYVVLGTMMVVAGALSSNDLGLRTWLVQILSPIFGTSNYFIFCCMILFFTCFITNLMSNQATIMIMLSIAATFMDKFVDAGYNVTPLVACVCCMGNFAFMLYCSGPTSPYFLDRAEMKKDQKFIFTYGPLFLLIAVIIGAAGSVLFGKIM